MRGVLTPETAEFAVLSFEGPDRYALAGGLGSRVSGLTAALADAGYATHLYFVGDPELPGQEVRAGGRLTLHRWCQWISRHHPGGVYDGEEGKERDYRRSVPPRLVTDVAGPAHAAGRRLFVLAEEWQTAAALCLCSDLLAAAGLRGAATLVWNANNVFGFERIDWPRLQAAATLTTVSRFMKHTLAARGLAPLVVPNGIPAAWLTPPPDADVAALRQALAAGGPGPVFVKVGRWDPDKRWLTAVAAVAALRRDGLPARILCKGGVGPHGAEVLRAAAASGLSVAHVRLERNGTQGLAGALAAAGDAALVNLQGFLDEGALRALYAAADAVLANSGMEPFGLVGLEAMAAGALVFVGATGEDYAVPLHNAVVIETDDPREIAHAWSLLRDRPERCAALRANGRATAATYRWERVLEVLLARLAFLAATAGR
jgi:glycosyltransferase involved in cell wall biosynthesis